MKTLLIVDDDPVFSLWCAEELEDDGYHTLRTTDGGKVMDMMSRHNPDLVLLDIRLGNTTAWISFKRSATAITIYPSYCARPTPHSNMICGLLQPIIMW
jgi:DNA-binding response OmpR family regulator